MRLETIKIVDSLHHAYFKQSLKRVDVERFKSNFKQLFDRINETESEEHNKNIVSDFLKNTYYKKRYEINTAGRKDLVIHKENTTQSPVAIIIEAKSPANRQEMLSVEKPNAKALHEIIHYFMHERLMSDNKEIKHLIITNIFDWYIFDAVEFEKHFYQNKSFRDNYQAWAEKKLVGTTTDWFYNEVAKPFVENHVERLACVHLNLLKYKELENISSSQLINLYKILSPEHLLKLPFANDYNKIDTGFYNELLHILGLEEISRNGKTLITRIKEKKRNPGSLLENTLGIIESKHRLKLVKRLDQFGSTSDEQLFSIALELVITWLNRILFLKLLEAQLIKYHKGNNDFAFLNTKKLKDFDELDELFFEVLARKPENRTASVNDKFGELPYLNSSLFEQTGLEYQVLYIGNLKDRLTMPVFRHTILKDKTGNRRSGELNTLQYLFEFLNAYSFASDDNAEIQDDNRTIINAAVLGLIFEKINGYKDGSFYTPGFITTYICREALRKTVLNKFRAVYQIPDNLSFDEGFEILKDKIDYTDKEQRQKANDIINSLKIIDPAVGSGHFLVSVLNELVAIKSRLRILQDESGMRLKGIKIENVNDELVITNEETSEPFQYYVNDKGFAPTEIQEIQQALFNEKRTLIEHCLFGVDINPKSVSICRLRLWIELLKNAYYHPEIKPNEKQPQLETLPNIDINIKTGNSLISFFNFNGNGIQNGQQKKLQKFTIEYKKQVELYKNITDTKAKDKIIQQIEFLKKQFSDFANPTDSEYVELKNKEAEAATHVIFFSIEEHKKWKNKQKRLEEDIAELKQKLVNKKQTIYKQAFEWRFEFPEVLDENGNFKGFDVVIGNPPYIGIQEIDWDFRRYYETIYETAQGRFDLYSLFVERATQILKHKGSFSFIVPGKFLNNKQFVAARKLIANNHHNVRVVAILDKVFDKAQVNSAIVEFTYSHGKQTYTSFTCEKEKFKKKSSVPLSKIQNDKQYVFRIDINPEIDRIIEKIRENTIPLKEIAEVKDGIVAGEIKDILYLKSKKSKYCRKLYFGKHISRYCNTETDTWVNYQPKKMMKIELERKKGKRPGLWMRDEKIFNREKILSRFVAKKIIAHYDSQNRYYEHTLHSTHITDSRFRTKYILALFNSTLFTFYYQKINSEGGNIFPQVRISSIENLPIKIVDIDFQKQIEDLVNQILTKKQKNPDADISKQTREIDRLVYQLYNLTDEEIKMIEKL